MTIRKFKTKNEMEVWCGTCRKSLQLFCLEIVFPNTLWCSKLAQNWNQKHPSQLRKNSLAPILQSWFSYSVRTGQDLCAWRLCKTSSFCTNTIFSISRDCFYLVCIEPISGNVNKQCCSWQCQPCSETNCGCTDLGSLNISVVLLIISIATINIQVLTMYFSPYTLFNCRLAEFQ